MSSQMALRRSSSVKSSPCSLVMAMLFMKAILLAPHQLPEPFSMPMTLAPPSTAVSIAMTPALPTPTTMMSALCVSAISLSSIAAGGVSHHHWACTLPFPSTPVALLSPADAVELLGEQLASSPAPRAAVPMAAPPARKLRRDMLPRRACPPLCVRLLSDPLPMRSPPLSVDTVELLQRAALASRKNTLQRRRTCEHRPMGRMPKTPSPQGVIPGWLLKRPLVFGVFLHEIEKLFARVHTQLLVYVLAMRFDRVG